MTKSKAVAKARTADTAPLKMAALTGALFSALLLGLGYVYS
ncbi:MAG: hypothetical protein AAF393_00770 [Pseudomonadota bacterium]